MKTLFRVATAVGLITIWVSVASALSPGYMPVLKTQLGDATYYGRGFHGKTTASGRTFDKNKAIAAHRTYPFGTVVRVTHLRTRRSVNVVILDRGPYGKNSREGAIIDLSQSAAKKLGILHEGQAKVKVEVLLWGNGEYVKT
jgi:rare lipoprotein A